MKIIGPNYFIPSPRSQSIVLQHQVFYTDILICLIFFFLTQLNLVKCCVFFLFVINNIAATVIVFLWRFTEPKRTRNYRFHNSRSTFQDLDKSSHSKRNLRWQKLLHKNFQRLLKSGEIDHYLRPIS